LHAATSFDSRADPISGSRDRGVLGFALGIQVLFKCNQQVKVSVLIRWCQITQLRQRCQITSVGSVLIGISVANAP